MLAQALAAYADTYLRDQLDDFAFEEKPVPYLLVIGPGGRYLGLRDMTELVISEKGGKRKEVRRVQNLSVPRSPVARNSAVAPLLAVDSIQYVVGVGPWTSEGKRANHEIRFAAFKELMAEVAKHVSDDATAAAADFYADDEAIALAREGLANAKVKEGTLVALAIRATKQPEPLIARPAIRQWWREHFAAQAAAKSTAATEATCLISGRRATIAATHAPIKGMASLGGQPSGVSLMSFDKHAFRSYGWDQNENAPASTERANAYVLALNDLLRPGPHRVGSSRDVLLRTRFDIDDTAFLFWTDVPVDENAIDEILDPRMDEERAILLAQDAEKASGVFAAPATGRRASRGDLTQFFLLGVSANGARLVVRRWISKSLADIRAASDRWFQDVSIANVFDGGRPAPRPKLFSLGRMLVRKYSEGSFEPLHATDSSALLARALGEGRLGVHFLAAALRQQQHADATGRLAPERGGLIRLLTNDCAQLLKDKGPPMPVSLSEEIDYPAYICGRLFAELENLQREANESELNASITDRYYAAACRNPRLALPRLLELKEAHLRKLRRSDKTRAAYFAISRRIDELVARFGGPPPEFPGPLSILDQGRFAIGYHHHRADSQRRREEYKAQKLDNA